MTMRILGGPLAAVLAIGVSATASMAGGRPSKFYPGDEVVLVLRDSTRISGKFVDLGRVTVEEYRDRYESWRRTSTEAGRLPQLGDRIELGSGRITTSGRLTFVGLGHEGVEVRRGDGATRTEPFNRFSRMVLADGQHLERSWIKQQCERGAPLVTTIEVAVADGTSIIPFDDVVGVESGSRTEPIETRRASFNSESSTPKWVASVQAVGLWAVDPSDNGLVAHGFAWRFSPSFVVPRVGADFQVGYLRDDEGDGGGFEVQVALCGAVPVGRYIGFAPRLGAGLIFGAGLGVPVTTIGAGVMLRLDPGMGLRADYTYEHLVGSGYNYEAISSLQLGAFWGR